MQFACYLVPLAVLELFFRAQDSSSAITKRAVAIVLIGSSLFMAAGVFGAQSFMWGPYYL
jgi:hypothetical protein